MERAVKRIRRSNVAGGDNAFEAARWAYFGQNGWNQDIPFALELLELATRSGHAEAQLLVTVLKTAHLQPVETYAGLVKSAAPRDLCFASALLVRDCEAVELLLAAAKGGYARAQAMVAECLLRDECAGAADWALKAAAQNDLMGLALLGQCYAMGVGVRQDAGRAFVLRLAAAERNWQAAQDLVGCSYLHGSGVAPDVYRFIYWAGRAIGNGSYRAPLDWAPRMVAAVEQFGAAPTPELYRLVYAFGESVYRHVYNCEVYIKCDIERNIRACKRAMLYYAQWTERCRRGTAYTQLCARFVWRLPRGVCNMIAQLVWNTRRQPDCGWGVERSK